MDPDLPDLSGRTYLVTGSTSGVGRDAARRLGARGATVLVHGRDADAGRAAVREVEDAGGSAAFLRADLASLAAVRDLARVVRGEHAPPSTASATTPACSSRGGGRATTATSSRSP